MYCLRCGAVEPVEEPRNGEPDGDGRAGEERSRLECPSCGGGLVSDAAEEARLKQLDECGITDVSRPLLKRERAGGSGGSQDAG